MGRCKKKCCCRFLEADRIFKPRGIPLIDLTVLDITADEFEALRLCDLENYDQEATAEQMGVSRGTVQRLLKKGRATLIRFLLENQALRVKGKES